jgi:eukaryotic-like serine/threonine-protein kinase
MTDAVIDRDHPWQTLASVAPHLDPGATVSAQTLAALGLAAPSVPPSVSLSRLPELGVRGEGEGGTEADLEITGVLGEGGMGRVVVARQRSLQRDVAIKMVKDGASPELLDALLGEAVVTGSLEHPSIVPVHFLGRSVAGDPLFVMKRIDGVSWAELAKHPEHAAWSSLGDEGDRLSAQLDIAMAVCNALHFAHSRGVVHRDVKPDNVMIGNFGEVYLVDWGIAVRVPQPAGKRSATVGTPAYMPPELVKGELSRVGPRTDVYLAGATLHAVLTGLPRHAGDSLFEVLHAAYASKPFDYGPEVPSELAAICNKATSADPDDRHGSALELRRAIASFRSHRGSIALSEAAAARLDAVRARPGRRGNEGGGEEGAGEERRLHAALTECRFGFVQALHIWEGNEVARAGLESCLELMIQHEIAQGDLEGARALLAEIAAPKPELEARLAALAADLEAAKAERARLRSIEHDQDLRVGGGAQLAILAVLPALAVFFAVWIIGRGATPSRFQLVLLPTAALAVPALVAVLGRFELRTPVSRKALGIIALMPALVIVHRALSLRVDIALPALAIGDLVIGAATMMALAIALVPRVAWVALPCLAGALGIALRPDLALPLFAASAASGFTLLLWIWRRSVAS